MSVRRPHLLTVVPPTHSLNVDSPGRELALVDGLEQALDTVIGVGTSQLIGLVLGQVLDAFVGPDVNLCVDELALLVDPLEGVSGVAVFVEETVWDTTVTEEDHDLVDGFRVLAEVVLRSRTHVV